VPTRKTKNLLLQQRWYLFLVPYPEKINLLSYLLKTFLLVSFYWQAFDSKKEVLITPAKDVKKEESTSETFNTMKQVCTPPSIDHRLLQRKKRPNSHGANVKRAILKTLSTDDSKPQSSNNENASHSTHNMKYGTD
jgi:hypothetical protein